MRGVIRNCAMWAIFGALFSTLGMFLYRSYILMRSGVEQHEVPPLSTLLMDVMELHVYAGVGAAIGAGLAILVMLISLMYRTRKSKTLPEMDDRPDPDEIIRAQRSKLADEYLSDRKGVRRN